jgi:hypothetical protein
MAEVTVTAQVAVLPPSCVVTVIVAVPAATPVTRPLFDTVAMLLLPLVHVTLLFVALSGFTVAVSPSVPPTVISDVVMFNDTPVTGTLPSPLLPPLQEINERDRATATEIIKISLFIISQRLSWKWQINPCRTDVSRMFINLLLE